MTKDELFLAFVNREQGHERIIGRYWASEISSIRKGYLKPQDFFKKKEIDLQGAKNILSGIAFERQFKEILWETGKEFQEPTKELKIGKDIIIVVKPDFLFKDKVLETKFPVSLTKEIPEKWKDQLECEYRAFKKPTYLGIFSHSFDIGYFRYEPSKERWESIQEIIKDFHSELCKIHQK